MTTTHAKALEKDRYRKFDVRPYGHTVHVVVSPDIREAVKKYDREGKLTVSDNCSAFTVVTPGVNDVWMFLPAHTSFDSINHESFHAVHFILTNCGVSFEEEVWAYHLGELSDSITRFVHLPKTLRKGL